MTRGRPSRKGEKLSVGCQQESTHMSAPEKRRKANQPHLSGFRDADIRQSWLNSTVRAVPHRAASNVRLI